MDNLTADRVLKPNIAIENVIRFPRMLAQNVIGYKVRVQEEVRDGVFAKYELQQLDNPVTPNPILHKERFEFRSDGVYQLPNETYYSPDYTIKLYINGVQINSLYITFNDHSKLLKINLSKVTINKTDNIELEYYRDEIEVKHSAINKCVYYVEPILDRSYSVGVHSISR